MVEHKKKSRWRRLLAGTFIVLLVLAFLGTLAFLYLKSRGEAPVYKTEQPKVTDIVKKAVATGSIVPRREVSIKPRVSGIVKMLQVEPGDHVEQGTLIAEIQIVPNMAALTQAEAAVHKARIAVKHAQVELHRAERLSGGGLLSQRALSERKLDHNLRRAELQAATSQLQVVKEGASRSRGDKANTKIRSTVAGMVLEVPVEEGGSVIESNNFNEGTTIATVADMGDMIFLGRIDEADVDKIRTGMAVKIRIGAIDERQFEGKLEYIAPKGSQIEGAIQFEIKAALTVPKDVVIRAGYSANAEIVLEEKPKVLAVSESLLQFDGEQPYVEVETGPGVYERRDLTVGISDGINIEVKDGVTAESKIRHPQPKPEG